MTNRCSEAASHESVKVQLQETREFSQARSALLVDIERQVFVFDPNTVRPFRDLAIWHAARRPLPTLSWERDQGLVLVC